jgi:hypothetical protein
LARFLERNHFELSQADQKLHYVEAKRGACLLKINRLAPEGSDQDAFRHLALGADRIFIVFRGSVYEHQPVWRTVLDIWSRRLRELGLSKRRTAVFAVAANKSCGVEQLPWDELRDAS